MSIAVFATSIGSLLGSSYSTFCTINYCLCRFQPSKLSHFIDGRRPVYLIGIPILFISSIGVAVAQSTSQLLFWRFFQAMGSSPALTIGSAVIGDIYKVEQRGTALGVFYAVGLFLIELREVLIFWGVRLFLWDRLSHLCLEVSILSLSCIRLLDEFKFSGFAAHYSSWRMLQIAVGIIVLCSFILMFLFFPETHSFDKSGPNPRPKLINPLRPLGLLRNPNLLFVVCVFILTAWVVADVNADSYWVCDYSLVLW